jgi:tetratricopeptide (TPR) repeat protein
MPRKKSRKMLPMEQVGPNEWKFDYPPAEYGINEQFDRGIDLMEEGKDRRAEEIFWTVMRACPEHIDAHHHLAMLLFDRGDILNALKTWTKAVEIGVRCLPEEFIKGEGRLEWSWIGNRPFLRACKGLGCCFLDLNELDSAWRIFNNLLAMNPNDNQGVRALAIKAAFAMDLPAEALKVCSHYKSDCLVDTLYGRPLALFQMGRIVQATKALIRAVDAYPLVARELLKKRHTIPKNLSSTYVTVGGADEAYDYWRNLGKYWRRTEGALDLLMKILPPDPQTTAKIIPFRR